MTYDLTLDAIVYVVLECDTNLGNSSYGEEAVDSIWTNEDEAKLRARQLPSARVETYRLNRRDGWLG